MRYLLIVVPLLSPIGTMTPSSKIGSPDGCSRFVSIIGWTMTVVLVGLLAGPISPALSEIVAGNPTPPAQVTLRFVSWKGDHPRAWDEALAQFAASHPHISVMREIAPHSSTAYHDLLTQKLKNRDATVDLFFMDIIWVPEFASAGWALALDDLFAFIDRQQFLPATIQTGQYGDHIYGVPSRIDSGMLFYRADLLTQYGFHPPKTWEELIYQADVIVEGERKTHPAMRGYSGQFKQYEGLICTMMEFIGSHGGSLVSENLTTSLLSTPNDLEAVRFVRDRIIGRTASRAVLTYQEPESVVPFVQGNAIFLRNWPYTWEIANDPRRSRVAGHIGVAPLPSFG